jgi:hypothetical protein
MTRSFQRRTPDRATTALPERPVLVAPVADIAPVAPDPEPAAFVPAPPSPAADLDDERPSTPPVYFGDLRLYTWSNSARTGMTVNLGVLDRSFTDIHPFKGLGIGKENGQRFRLWIAEHCDDDSPISVAPVVF